MAYNLDIQKFVYRHLRSKLRTSRQLAWLESLLSPLTFTIDNVNEYRLQKLIELSYNGQTFALENVLNDNFDTTLRRIYILNEQIFNEVDWLISENQPGDYDFFLGEVSGGTFGTAGLMANEGYLFYIGENPNSISGTNGTSGNAFDFEVIVPISLIGFDSQIHGFIDKYRLAGKRYIISYV